MPLSLLTRLRGVIIVAAFAFALLWLEISDQMWAWATGFFLMPLLIWLLVSNAVKDAPPFDDTAFHRTRPVTAGQAYRHLVGFHLLVLCCILLLVLAYVWRFNLGWREAISGVISVAIPLIAVGSLFGATASLWTSSKHWKGWPFVLLLLLPAISLFACFAIAMQHPTAVSFAGLTFAGALIYPALWWLAAVKGRWLVCNVLGLWIGIAMPWMPLPIESPDNWLPPSPVIHQTASLDFKRPKDLGGAKEMNFEQAAVSRLMEVRGLGPDEYIQVSQMGIALPRPEGFANTLMRDPALEEMSSTCFSANEQGRLIPATHSLLRVMGSENRSIRSWDNRPDYARERSLENRLNLPICSYLNSSKQPHWLSPGTEPATWTIQGHAFRWLKVLDVPAVSGGRAKLPKKGTIRMLPLEVTSGDFAVTLQITGAGLVGPVVVARSPDGEARFIDLQVSGAPREGFLTRETEYEFREEIRQPRGDERLKILRSSRIEVYGAEPRGPFSANIPPPE